MGEFGRGRGTDNGFEGGVDVDAELGGAFEEDAAGLAGEGEAALSGDGAGGGVYVAFVSWGEGVREDGGRGKEVEGEGTDRGA